MLQKLNKDQFREKLNERIQEDLVPVDIEEIVDEILNQSYPEIEIGTLTFDPAIVLKELDPISYEQEMSNCSEHYYKINKKYFK